ncbi:MAG: NADP-dependent malic enzyme [Acholeplasmatales bacterium]|jgi:malate dehydrogenase (oxaloacetate-decarboxylating)|nr:NADP-dependent malic enzyme [Acholeplasmataceae bacterium]MCK9288973.1 NADP-dependent malic enzyme [Acholeplasmataceae bacterium]MCK9427567.1 NADP-dependent malic enzyme [Acholeplasmataceae bacterium]MDY0115489.1 NADP-dependent malic enzyme [Acholeplasmatales bacterium]HHT39249.1 NADP-dependent malic enzyme [Acholeplasmataceae bacterium]
MTLKKEALDKHYQWKGKIETKLKAPLNTNEDLMIAYTPGVAEACLAINADKEKSFSLTGRANLVAVITDGSAVLGLGNIGPEASMPVMEGKCALFKRFADLDCVPLSLNTQDVNEIIKTIEYLAPNFGGINLEDIKAPNCFIIEEALKERLDIPVFHDDQHGTAIVVGAAVINALKIVKKSLKEIKIVINGAGAAGIAIAKFLLLMGNNNIIMVDKKGILTRTEKQDNPLKDQIAQLTNHQKLNGDLAKALRNADLFIGVSAGNLVNEEMVKLMNKDPIVFALANPIPEITPTLAKKAGAKVVGSGSNLYENQINNALAFPGLFKGALLANATKITANMMVEAAYAIASYPKEIKANKIMPSILDEGLHQAVSKKVFEQAIKDKVTR